MPENLVTNAQDEQHFVPLKQICVGAKLQMPIHDERDVLLLASGQFITEQFLDRLFARGIQNLKVHSRDLPYVVAGKPQGSSTTISAAHVISSTSSEQNAVTRLLDAALAAPGAISLPPQGEAFAKSVAPPPRESYSAGLQREMVENQIQSIRQLGGMFEGLLGGKGVNLDSLTAIADDALQGLASDCDIFASLGLNPLSTDYPARHGLHCCMLALSIGTNLQLDRTTLRELAIGCLVHDAGMLKIKRPPEQQSRRLSDVEFLEITKHPIRVFDLLRNVESISNRSAFIAYQMHERNDGSGYPRKRQGSQIHFLSKVAAVADVYTAISAARPHRPGLLPHCAIEHVVRLGNSGQLDASAVRALLSTTSMYPIGSYVLLSDGRVARTIRSNGLEFNSPVVEAWKPGKLNQPPEVVDLLETQDISVLRPIPSLDCDVSQLMGTRDEAADMRIDRIVELINLADASPSPDVLELRQSPRHEFRRPIKIYFKGGIESDSDWQNHTFESRDISAGGLSLIGQKSDLPDEVVVVLENGGVQPVYLLSRVVRRKNVLEDWYEYGIMFLKKVAVPRSAAARHDESRISLN